MNEAVHRYLNARCSNGKTVKREFTRLLCQQARSFSRVDLASFTENPWPRGDASASDHDRLLCMGSFLHGAMVSGGITEQEIVDMLEEERASEWRERHTKEARRK